MILNGLPNQAMERSMDALWLKMRVISDNIANYETPGYKTKSVTFQQVLQNVQDGDETQARRAVFRTNVYRDTSTSSRMDGNNVVMEKEQTELWKTEAQFAYLTQKISGSYSNLRTIISQMAK